MLKTTSFSTSFNYYMNSKANILRCNTLYSYRCLLSPTDTANLVMITRSFFQNICDES